MSTHIGDAWRAAGLFPIAMAVQYTGSITPGPDRIRDFRHRLFGVPHGRAKDIVADDVARVRTAFGYIATDPSCRKTFQATFTNLNRERARDTSRAHDALARLVYSKHVIRVISLNWDTLLESAFARRYGADINAQASLLLKPHGDCADPNADWMLPYEGGSVSDDVVADLNSLAAERPRVLPIVGYSADDYAVLQRLACIIHEGRESVTDGACWTASGASRTWRRARQEA